jgi:hypothetical protein
MVKAWAADVTPLYDRECYERYYAMVPDFRKRKADRLRLAGMRAQSIGVWILWEKIRKKYSLPENVPFNFSHSGSIVMCAACMDGGPVKVGCDVEKMGGLRLKLAERHFCREEYEAIMAEENEEKRTEMFYRYWVLKESFMKATGKGMALPLDQFCIRLDKPPVLIRKPEEFSEAYYYCEYDPGEKPYRLAVCTSDTQIDTELHTEFIL